MERQSMIWLITVLLSVVLSARAQEPKDATSPLHEDEKVYFVTHGNHFMGYYSGKNVGFRAFREHHPLADVVEAWKNVNNKKNDDPGVNKAGQHIIVAVDHLEIP